ncbi:hypothetical protein [Flavobacterium gawalongense]|uniref:Uncharacterized protein n=1 Tax=Flavobacterium gawalongense TaxID=2594432 RepID=A0A553BSU5_9FLAO|nr:hypothetical protein [Flavobacterium gawalongense]TRX03647.1 hypothetical protein FNW33_02970 [Flavobacterium gawalongense]TRX08794.1 hypothetical protein FNW12_03110 [Flavobacterium gawalongense]TRX11326.1 hypothetical protein FNW11_06260 [Flavobacterium gawalongense]TRX12213.1 hypothetical protein FNW10_04920 [Flavobacterium gawalongense]TRX30248.1 hypothetical protein FNW38_05525 [Flavobacterium gawalongense]
MMQSSARSGVLKNKNQTENYEIQTFLNFKGLSLICFLKKLLKWVTSGLTRHWCKPCNAQPEVWASTRTGSD